VSSNAPRPPLDVWFLTTGLAAGGAERALATLAPRLAAHDVRPSVFSLRGEGRFGPELRAAGIEVADLGIRGVGSAIGAWRRLGALARRRSPALLQGWMYHGNLLATAVAAISGIPASWAVRQSLADLDRSPAALRAVVRAGAILSARPRGVLYNSRVALEQHREIGYLPPFEAVVPNGFDLGRFRPDRAARSRVRARLGLPADATLVVHVARFHPVKGLDILLDAFAALAAGTRLILAGRGMDAANADLAAAISRRGLGTAVLPLGEVDDVAELVAAGDLLVHASLGEGFPNAVGEAMACGVPVVATRAGDTEALVGDAGFLVAPGDSRALAAALASCLGLSPEERERRGAAGRARVAERFDADRSAAALAGYLRRAAGETA
jgi:glycosyltransferase involved in cell wall biosynthesis